MAPIAADNAPIASTTVARREQEIGPSSPAVISARPMESSSARTPTAEDLPREMLRRPPGPPDFAGNHLTRIEEDAMDQPDAVRRHNRDAWDAEVERGNRWTVPVDHQAIEAARRGRLEVLLTDSRAVPAAWFPDLDGA